MCTTLTDSWKMQKISLTRRKSTLRASIREAEAHASVAAVVGVQQPCLETMFLCRVVRVKQARQSKGSEDSADRSVRASVASTWRFEQ